MKYPIGIQTFSEIIENGYVYVDKTDLVYKLVQEDEIYFLTRPRWFGKSLLISTLKAYFEGRKELFKGLKIDALEKEWAEYSVFHLSFSGNNFMEQYTLGDVLEEFVGSLEETYGKNPFARTLGSRFRQVIKAAHKQTGRRVVVLIDEYDKPLLDVMCLKKVVKDRDGEGMSLEAYNRNILKGFYGVLKAADEDLRFVFLTGVTKFSQVSVFSDLNQIRDISMDNAYEAICGITRDELLTVFDEPIRELAGRYRVDYDEMVRRLKKRYDGYHFGSSMVNMFNPFSLLNCFIRRELYNAWFMSGSPTYLVRLLQSTDININEMAGKYYDVAQFITYRANLQQPLPMVYQSGYLTIKDYDPVLNIYLLDYPNEEVRASFIDVIASNYFQDAQTEARSWVIDVVKGLRCGNVDLFVKQMTALLSSVTYRFQRKDDTRECERYFQYTFYLIMQMIATYSTCVEKETSEGRIDCVVETPDYVYILEFKLNGNAKAALQQIHDRGYAKPYSADRRKVICLGINFSSQTGTIEGCEVEQVEGGGNSIQYASIKNTDSRVNNK